MNVFYKILIMWRKRFVRESIEEELQTFFKVAKQIRENLEQMQ